MAGAIMEKVWGLFGMEPAEDRDEEIEEVDTEEVENDEEEPETAAGISACDDGRPCL